MIKTKKKKTSLTFRWELARALLIVCLISFLFFFRSLFAIPHLFLSVRVKLKRWLSPYLLDDLIQIVLDYQGLLPSSHFFVQSPFFFPLLPCHFFVLTC
jgi:hypothetical protein